MKTSKAFVILALTIPFLTLSPAGQAADTNAVASSTNAAAKAIPPKPDKLATCPVSGDKLDGDMGKPLVFVYQGQEVKLCCAGCKKEFYKNPAKYIKKIR